MPPPFANGSLRFGIDAPRFDGDPPPIANGSLRFGVDLMRRAFVRLLGITPRRYRELAEPSNRDRQWADR